MAPHIHSSLNASVLYDSEFFNKIQSQFIHQYSMSVKLACEMTWDLIEILKAAQEDRAMLTKKTISDSNKLTVT